MPSGSVRRVIELDAQRSTHIMKLLGLFPNQKEADEAVDALAKADLGDLDIRVLSEWTDELTEQLNVMPVSNPSSGLSGIAGPRGRTADDILDETSKGEAVKFFKRSLQKGGLVVAVDVSSDRYKKQAESILEKQNAVAVTREV
jgi:hypothetical protein